MAWKKEQLMALHLVYLTDEKKVSEWVSKMAWMKEQLMALHLVYLTDEKKV